MTAGTDRPFPRLRVDKPHSATCLAFLVKAAQLIDDQSRTNPAVAPHAIYSKTCSLRVSVDQAKRSGRISPLLEWAATAGVKAACDVLLRDTAPRELRIATELRDRVVAGICFLEHISGDGSSNETAYERVARKLSRGAPYTYVGFSARDVRRAEERFGAELSKQCSSTPSQRDVLIAAEIHWCQTIVAPLTEIYDSARRRFRRLQGEALAQTIDAREGLGKRIGECLYEGKTDRQLQWRPANRQSS